MVKVKMVSRHTAESGEKLEKGLYYSLPRSYAEELVAHGIAVFVSPPPIAVQPPVNVNLGPSRTMAMETALREMKGKKPAIAETKKKAITKKGAR